MKTPTILGVEELGSQVAAKASSGDLAVELARTVKQDSVFMDIRLAGAMVGIEAARQILAGTKAAKWYL